MYSMFFALFFYQHQIQELPDHESESNLNVFHDFLELFIFVGLGIGAVLIFGSHLWRGKNLLEPDWDFRRKFESDSPSIRLIFKYVIVIFLISIISFLIYSGIS